MDKHRWEKVNTLVAVVVILTEVGPSRQLNFLDAKCLESYQCHKPGIPCQVKVYSAGCPIQYQENQDLTPSAPQKFQAEIVYTFNNVTEKCEGSPTISWIPPNTAGAETLTGFMVALKPFIHGGNMEVCVVLDLSGTNWTQEIIESEPEFSFDCFRTTKSGRYFITLTSLPLPKYKQTPQDCCDQTVMVSNYMYYYDSTSETCRLRTTTTTTITTTMTTTTTSATNTKGETTPTKSSTESSTATANHHSLTPASAKNPNSSFPYKVLALGLAVLLCLTIVVAVIFIIRSRRSSGEAPRALNNANGGQNQYMLGGSDVTSDDLISQRV